MSLLLHIIVTYIKGNIITKLQKLYNPPRNPGAGNKSPALFVKKSLCTGDLSPALKIFPERPVKWKQMTAYTFPAFLHESSQPAITCSKLKIETLEQGVSLLLTLDIFHTLF